MRYAINRERRRFVGAGAMTLAATQLAVMPFADAQTVSKKESPPQPEKSGMNTSFTSLKQVNAGLLSVGYAEAGPAEGPVVLLLHLARDAVDLMDALRIHKATLAGFDWGARTANIVAALWPERCKALVSVSGYLIGSQEAGRTPLPPSAELQWWYQYYFATDRGTEGYDKYRRDFAKLIWQLASPKWTFDEARFARSAAAFDNPDHVSIVIHNYRWRLGLVQGEAQYDELEERLSAAPGITVPTITLEGDANGAPHPEPASYARKFSGKYAHRTIEGGVGHNLPQEAPQAFAQAVIDVEHI